MALVERDSGIGILVIAFSTVVSSLIFKPGDVHEAQGLMIEVAHHPRAARILQRAQEVHKLMHRRYHSGRLHRILLFAFAIELLGVAAVIGVLLWQKSNVPPDLQNYAALLCFLIGGPVAAFFWSLWFAVDFGPEVQCTVRLHATSHLAVGASCFFIEALGQSLPSARGLLLGAAVAGITFSAFPSSIRAVETVRHAQIKQQVR